MPKPRGKSSAEKRLMEHRQTDARIRRRHEELKTQGRHGPLECTLRIVREENDRLLALVRQDLLGLRVGPDAIRLIESRMVNRDKVVVE